MATTARCQRAVQLSRAAQEPDYRRRFFFRPSLRIMFHPPPGVDSMRDAHLRALFSQCLATECSEDVFRMIHQDREMSLIRIEGRATVGQGLCQASGRPNRHHSIPFSMPQEYLLECDPFDLEPPRVDLLHRFFTICQSSLAATFNHRPRKTTPEIEGSQESLDPPLQPITKTGGAAFRRSPHQEPHRTSQNEDRIETPWENARPATTQHASSGDLPF